LEDSMSDDDVIKGPWSEKWKGKFSARQQQVLDSLKPLSDKEREEMEERIGQCETREDA
jgi:hypothetical protein